MFILNLFFLAVIILIYESSASEDDSLGPLLQQLRDNWEALQLIEKAQEELETLDLEAPALLQREEEDLLPLISIDPSEEEIRDLKRRAGPLLTAFMDGLWELSDYYQQQLSMIRTPLTECIKDRLPRTVPRTDVLVRVLLQIVNEGSFVNPFLDAETITELLSEGYVLIPSSEKKSIMMRTPAIISSKGHLAKNVLNGITLRCLDEVQMDAEGPYPTLYNN